MNLNILLSIGGLSIPVIAGAAGAGGGGVVIVVIVVIACLAVCARFRKKSELVKLFVNCIELLVDVLL